MKCVTPPLHPDCQLLREKLEHLETKQREGENEIIDTITLSKAAVSKTVKVAHCQDADLCDWLQHAWHSSVTWCFVIFFTVTLRDVPHPRKQHLHRLCQVGVITHVYSSPAELFLHRVHVYLFTRTHARDQVKES